MPRPRKGAHIYRRPGRRSWYAYVDRDHRDVSLDTEDEVEAQARLNELLQSRRVRETTSADRTVAACFAELLKRSNATQTKKTRYEVGLNSRRILAYLEEREIVYASDVTKEIAEHYKQARRFQDSRRTKGKISAARINRELSTWKQGMKIAVEWGAARPAALDAFVKIREPRPQPHQVGLTKKQIEAFLRAEKHPAYKALFRVVIGTGMRDDEIRHLDATDIRPPWIIVTPKAGWTTKGYRFRQIPASKETQKAARAFAKLKSTVSLDPKTVWKRVQEAAARAKIGIHFSMHDLRRAWASHMLAAGHRIEDISRWLGHADLLTTMRYLRVVTTATPKPSSLPF